MLFPTLLVIIGIIGLLLIPFRPYLNRAFNKATKTRGIKEEKK